MSDHAPGHPIPRISLRGTPFQRGQQYGQQARTLVRQSVQSYERVFAHHAQWDWPAVVRHAGTYQAATADFAPSAVEEMRGIADGAGLDYGDILALNVRSEVMFASGAEGGDRLAEALANECSAFAVLPEAAGDGHTLIGQNWDWLLHARGTVVLVDVRRDDGPGYLTLVEAGLLAKTGVNAAGVAVCTNTLVSVPGDEPGGVPYHVLLRRLLDAESITAATSTVINADKALSANYLLGAADGLAIDLEAVPGGLTAARPLMPERGVLVHANHFLSPDLARTDRWLGTSPGTLFRQYCLRSALDRATPTVTVPALQRMLSDHRNYPHSVCAHSDDRAAEYERYATIASIIYDLDAREVHLAPGSPCTTAYGRYQLDWPGGAPEAPMADGARAVMSR